MFISSSSSSRFFYLSFRNVFEKPTQHVTSPGSFPSYIVWRMIPSSFTLGYTSFFTRSIPWYGVNILERTLHNCICCHEISVIISTTVHGSLYRIDSLHKLEHLAISAVLMTATEERHSMIFHLLTSSKARSSFSLINTSIRYFDEIVVIYSSINPVTR